MVELIKLVTDGPDDTPDACEATHRLQSMERHEDAEELEMLFARAEELRPASSDSS